MAKSDARGMSRREFLKGAAKAGIVAGVAAAGLGKLGGIVFAQQGGKSRVVQVISNGVMKDNVPDAAIVEKMLNKAMCEFGGKKTAAEVWSGLFTKDDVVCLKINCIATNRASTKPQLVGAIAKGLVSAGVRENNIIVWERNANEMKGAGYTINAGASGVMYVATDMPGFGYSDPMTAGSVTSRLSKVLMEKATAMINVPILKNHGGAGITLALKNHFGTIDNPNAAHGKGVDMQKFIADLNTLDPIKKKTRLVIADCLRCVFEGGPGAKNPDQIWNYEGLLVGADPVAVDYVGWQIIEEKRKSAGLKSLEATRRKPTHIDLAAKLGLGNSDPARIDLVKVTV